MKQFFTIDKDLFRKELDKTNIPYARISEGIGHSHSFIHLVIREGKISESDASRLERFYGVQRDAYRAMLKPETKQAETIVRVEKAEEKAACGLDYVQLYNTIYTAVLAALQANVKGLHEQGKLFEVK